MIPRILGGLALAAASVGELDAQADQPGDAPLHFVVVGHPRGKPDRQLNPKLGELIDEVKRLRPEFVLITGDIIYGEYRAWPIEAGHIERQWEQVDSAFATLGVPIYRVPGNHDLHDPVTQEIWDRRYGPLPRAVEVRGHKLLLLSSVYVRPATYRPGEERHVGGIDLDSAHLAFLRRELAGDVPGSRTFVAMHHLLWWEPDAAWWRDVHPLLATAGVRAVFTGDYGPLKFSTHERDGVRYFQTSIDENASIDMQRARVNSRVLSHMFDNYLEVTASDDTLDVRVHVVAALTSGQFTPRTQAAIAVPWPSPPLWRRILRRPELIAAGAFGALLLAGTAFVAGRYSARRRTPQRPA
jgi:hypothetical protein